MIFHSYVNVYQRVCVNSQYEPHHGAEDIFFGGMGFGFSFNGSASGQETLQQVRLRKIPMAAKPREDSYTEFDQDLIRALNPKKNVEMLLQLWPWPHSYN